MRLGHVIALSPNKTQIKQMVCAAGVARFTYNWGLNKWNEQYEKGLKPNGNKLRKEFNNLKREAFPWVMESPKDANNQAFRDLQQGWKNFFDSNSGKRKGLKVGKPTFKKKNRNGSFYVSNDKFHFEPDGKHVVLPIFGRMRIREPLRLKGKICFARVKCKAGRWYLSVVVDVADPKKKVPKDRRKIVGVDLGIKTAAVVSQGASFDAPRPLRRYLKKLKQANRRLSRRQKGGSNRRKACECLAKIHEKIANIRKDFWQKATTHICLENQEIVIEDLYIQFMLKNHKMAHAASDVALGMFRPMMVYKQAIFDCKLHIADRWFPSTQRCSRCGCIKCGENKMVLGQSVFVCDVCGYTEDRDKNSSYNLEQYPKLSGNWRPSAANAHGDHASTDWPVQSASEIEEVGTKMTISVDVSLRF